MASKKENSSVNSEIKENPFVEQNITNTLEENYMPYAMSVIVSRAIPEIDGLKPSHRKLLYTMYKKGLLSGSRTKSANVVGETMRLNPHGDQAIYETMVRMTRDHAALLHPYVDSKGNFGKHFSRDTAFAAARYTEVKLEKICEELFKDIDKNTVEFVDNYDGEMKEPSLLPVTFPTILVNPNQGVAVGMATNICSFNLHEICDATCAYIDNKNADLIQYIKAPDFSTGGTVIYTKKVLENIIETGRGSLKIRGKYRFDKKNSCIEIYEIPYTTASEVIMEEIIKTVKEGKIKDITDVRDETDLKGLKITVDIKKSADPDEIANKLYKFTSLESSFACNFNVLINGTPKVLGVRGLIKEWLDFRIQCIKRQLAFDIKQKKDRLHLLKGLDKILLDIDKAIKIIRETEHDDLVVPNLMWGFGIDEIQANFIAEIKLRNLNKEYILSKLDEIDKLISEIADLEDMLNKEGRIKSRIKHELRAIEKKYAKDRITDVINEEEVTVITDEHLIEDYNLKVFLTREGYVKKIPLVSLRSSPEQKLKDGDEIVQEAEWHNKSEILFISDKQTVYKMKLYELPESKAGALGEYVTNILGLDADENIVYFILTDNYSGEILFAFENGKVSRIPLSAYETKTNRKKLINAYGAAAPLVNVLFIQSAVEIAISSSNDRIIICSSDLIPLKTTKSTQGVQVLKLKKDYTLKYMRLADKCAFSDPKAYRTKNIPIAGSFVKDADKAGQQLTLF